MAIQTFAGCRCCPEQSGSGSGSGSGPDDRVPTACCPLVERRLYLTFGGSQAHFGTVPIDYTSSVPSGPTTWGPMATGDWCADPLNPAEVTLQCLPGGDWTITWGVGGPPVLAPGCFGVQTSCEPLYVTFSGCSSNCGGYTATLTETPP